VVRKGIPRKREQSQTVSGSDFGQGFPDGKLAVLILIKRKNLWGLDGTMEDMAGVSWFVHMQGEVLGPLATEVVTKMLEQGRVQFGDFVWRKGFAKWIRIMDVDAFQGALPPYPKVPIPESEAEEEAAKPKPRSEPRSEPKQETKPVRKAEAKVEAKVEPKSKPEPKAESKDEAKVRKWQFPRVPIEATAVFEGIGSLKVVNIAEKGIFVQAKSVLPLGTPVKFRLDAKTFEKSLEMTGVVIRQGQAEKNEGFAVEFTRVNPAHKRAISQYIISKLIDEGQ